MSALELPPQEDSEATSRNIRLLAVPQPKTDGQLHLSGVQGEIDIIRNLASSSPFVGFQEADGTVEDVLSKMTQTDWIHFVCHGTQDRTNPFDSGFLLAHGRRLKLPDIARVSRPRGGLAFLSPHATLQRETSNFPKKLSILRRECFLLGTEAPSQRCGRSWTTMRRGSRRTFIKASWAMTRFQIVGRLQKPCTTRSSGFVTLGHRSYLGFLLFTLVYEASYWIARNCRLFRDKSFFFSLTFLTQLYQRACVSVVKWRSWRSWRTKACRVTGSARTRK